METFVGITCNESLRLGTFPSFFLVFRLDAELPVTVFSFRCRLQEPSRVHRLSISTVLALSILAVTPAAADAVAITFQTASGTTPLTFTVFGDVLGPNNILSVTAGGTVWNDEWGISDVSQWSIFDTLVPDSYPNNLNAYGQMMTSSNAGFRYQENIDGYNTATREYWGHGIDITGGYGPGTPLSLAAFLNVPGAFSYVETVFYATNYTFDGTTTPQWTRYQATGTLTMTAFVPADAAPPTSVPEPASFFLSLTGIAVLGLRRCFRSSDEER